MARTDQIIGPGVAAGALFFASIRKPEDDPSSRSTWTVRLAYLLMSCFASKRLIKPSTVGFAGSGAAASASFISFVAPS